MRKQIVVDVETNGLDIAKHDIVEIAWYDLSTDEYGSFIPIHDPYKILAKADLFALQINKYVDRIALATQDSDLIEYNKFLERIADNTIAGSNPAFDAMFIRKMINTYIKNGDKANSTWHHRLFDLSSYAMGILDLEELPGLHKVCELLEIVNESEHSAIGDVKATVQCFRKLKEMKG
jgi:DNA polymerase-3 subunit epsilon